MRDLYPQSEELFDIVLVTYNHAHVGIRLINTINHHSRSSKREVTCKQLCVDHLNRYASNTTAKV